eukprot:3911773-Amphidinium_carterae.2
MRGYEWMMALSRAPLLGQFPPCRHARGLDEEPVLETEEAEWSRTDPSTKYNLCTRAPPPWNLYRKITYDLETDEDHHEVIQDVLIANITNKRKRAPGPVTRTVF